MENPLDIHWKAIKGILRYLFETLSYGLQLRKSSRLCLVAYCDFDWALSIDGRRSTFGMCIFLGNNLVTWSLKKRRIVSCSSTEAEYRSIANVMAKIAWFQTLLTELHIILLSPPVIWSDNINAISICSNLVHHSKTKHIQTNYLFERKCKTSCCRFSMFHQLIS